MIAASSAWVAAHRQLLLPEMFIEIAYTVTEPGLQEEAVASGPTAASFAKTADITSAVEKVGNTYATLEHGIWGLDGNFPYFAQATNPGYVSSALCDSRGIFVTPPKIVISFSSLHTMLIPGLSITWSSSFNEWAEEFRITAWADSQQVADTTVRGNKSVYTEVEINLEGYNRIEIEIIKWSHSYHRARCSHVALNIRTVFTKEDLTGFEHSQSADLLSASLPNNTVTFKLRNEDGRWNPDNPQNVTKFLLDQQEIRVRYGMDINGKVEWIEGGLFWLDEWSTPSNGIEASFTARDELTFMHAVYTGPLKGTLYEIAEVALKQASLPALSTGAPTYYISPVLKDYSTDVSGGALQDTALSAVVQMAAHAANCVLFQDRYGTIRIQPWEDSYSGYLIDPHVSFSHPEYTISKPLKEVSVGYGDGQRVIVANHGTGETQTIDNPMLNTEEDALRVGRRAAEVLNNRKVITGDFRADVRLDCLDPIIVTSKYASNIIAITDVHFSTTGGAIQGKYTGRVVSIHLTPEVKYSGEFYAGEM